MLDKAISLSWVSIILCETCPDGLGCLDKFWISGLSGHPRGGAHDFMTSTLDPLEGAWCSVSPAGQWAHRSDPHFAKGAWKYLLLVGNCDGLCANAQPSERACLLYQSCCELFLRSSCL